MNKTRERFILKMFSKLVVVVFCALQFCNYVISANNPGSHVPGTPIIRSLAVALPAASTVEKESCDAGKLFDCKNCSQRLICDTKGAVLAARECTGSTPYCSNGTCVEDLPALCPAPVSPLCPVASQTYPSPVSCQRYIKCDAKRLATEYLCPNTLVYDPLYYLCKRPYYNRDCPAINCTENRGKFIVYPLQTNLYFYCGANGDPSLLQCASDKEFNVAELRCEPKCVRPGLLAADNKREYYICAYNNDGGFDKYVMTCPNNTKFEASSGNCV